MKEDPENKARRRNRLRELFPPPLDQVALRHVDAVQALEDRHKAILASVLAKIGIGYVTPCLAALKKSGEAIQSDTDLMGFLALPQQAEQDNIPGQAPVIDEIDMGSLAILLSQCYPDMPEASAGALAASDVMAQTLRVVTDTRLALGNARSDFVITVLYTLFEERLNEIEKTIAGNPSFIKAMQLSRPHWKPKPAA
jgi:hypothetical protein